MNKHDLAVRVSFVTTTPNKVLLEKIREFLLSHLDEYSCILGSCTKLININDKKIRGNNKPISILEIYQIDYLCNILIPYFDSEGARYARPLAEPPCGGGSAYNLELKNIWII
uniref:LAGLIDADG endonuclease n=1 Tax=Morchella brunnea TaxID=1174671 RepID=A0A8K1I7V2_9PEZI|nr:LAGLIDADG endonuclease [Morchella brunnea]UBU98518.1 LAGLIDADG endonuclease [Morchella brunnea]